MRIIDTDAVFVTVDSGAGPVGVDTGDGGEITGGINGFVIVEVASSFRLPLSRSAWVKSPLVNLLRTSPCVL